MRKLRHTKVKQFTQGHFSQKKNASGHSKAADLSPTKVACQYLDSNWACLDSPKTEKKHMPVPPFLTSIGNHQEQAPSTPWPRGAGHPAPGSSGLVSHLCSPEGHTKGSFPQVSLVCLGRTLLPSTLPDSSFSWPQITPICLSSIQFWHVLLN